MGTKELVKILLFSIVFGTLVWFGFVHIVLRVVK
jgi:hypothetical protein